MKRTKKIVAVVVALMLVLSVSSMAFAAPGDSNTDTTVKVEVKEAVAKQISATVPLEMAIALQKTGTNTGNVTVPTNYAITNTSKDATDAEIRVTAISAMSPVGSAWSLSSAPSASKQLKLGFGATASYFPELAAGATSKVYLQSIPTELTNIAKDSSALIPVSAEAKFGTGINDVAAASSEAYKVSFTIAPQVVEPVTFTASAATGITVTTAPASGNKNVYKVAAAAITPPNIGDTVVVGTNAGDWKVTAGATGLTQSNHIVVIEVTADNRVVKVSADATVGA